MNICTVSCSFFYSDSLFEHTISLNFFPALLRKAKLIFSFNYLTLAMSSRYTIDSTSLIYLNIQRMFKVIFLKNEVSYRKTIVYLTSYFTFSTYSFTQNHPFLIASLVSAYSEYYLIYQLSEVRLLIN